MPSRHCPWSINRWNTYSAIAVGGSGSERAVTAEEDDAMDGSSSIVPDAKPQHSRARQRRVPVQTKTINLALQGGGAHGAFTWGVLDRILEDERIVIEGLSATSAGAMNAAVFTYGYAIGGRDGAKPPLAGFWRRVSHAAMQGPLQPSWLDKMTGNPSLQFSPAFIMADLMTRLFSPYELIP